MFWGKIEEGEKAGSPQELNPGHLACASSALPLSHDNRTTTSPHNPPYVLHRGIDQMPQLHTWQPLSMCHQNSIRGLPKNSPYQERTHAEWFLFSKCLERLPHKIQRQNRGKWTGQHLTKFWLHILSLPGVWLRYFSTTCAVHIEYYKGWWLSGCYSSVAEHWLHKPGVLGFNSWWLPTFSLNFFSKHLFIPTWVSSTFFIQEYEQSHPGSGMLCKKSCHHDLPLNSFSQVCYGNPSPGKKLGKLYPLDP